MIPVQAIVSTLSTFPSEQLTMTAGSGFNIVPGFSETLAILFPFFNTRQIAAS